MKKIKRFIARNANGAFWGGLGGVILFVLKDKIPFIEKLALESGWFWNTATFIFIGMSVGILIDHLYKKKV